MQKLTILVATILMIAPIASAQITAGPIGPFAMVDADGDLMGGAISVESEAVWAVALSTSVGSGFVEVQPSSSATPSSGQLDSFRESALFFASTNCTGQAHVNADQMQGLDGGPKLVVGGPNQTLYAITDSPLNVVIASKSWKGLCETLSSPFQTLLLPVSNVGSLDNTFTPPFRIVTASGQAASVPLLSHISHWILAAALIGAFALYDRRRMARLGLS